MVQVKRLGHATLTSPDLERGINYYADILGLSVYEKSNGRVIFGTRTGYEAIELEKGDRMSLKRLSFQVAPGTDLKDVARDLEKHGLKTETRSDITPGVKKAVTFEDPKGTMIDIYADYEFPEDDGKQSTITLLKLGHVAYRVHDAQSIVKFYCDVLGFRVSDWRQNTFAFLRCGVDHHSINFLQDKEQRLHHFAFEVRDWSEIHKSCDYLGKHNLHLVWGPGRHNIGHNIAIYHMNPDRARVEFYTEMDQMIDEELGYFAPRPWHSDRPQRPMVWPKETLRNYWGFGSEPDLNRDL